MTGRSDHFVITGAAGGIGLAVAKTLLKEPGAAAHLVDRSTSALEQVVDVLASTERVQCHSLDVTDGPAWTRFMTELGDTPIRGLVTAAGVLDIGGVDDVSSEDWDRVLDINLKGTFLACKHVLPSMRGVTGAAVVTVSSVSGRTRSTYAAPNYVASKAGVIGLTMSLAAQEAPCGVRVNGVAPGVIDTEMIAGYGQERKAQLISQVPMGRLGTPGDVANVVDWLLSQRSDYVTGQIINVNGGQFMS